VEDLGAVVGDLGSLAVMELGDEARLGHVPRVCGQDPRHVLPEHAALRAQGAREERRREVRPAPAEGRELALGAGADEARDDGDLEAPKHRKELAPRPGTGEDHVRGRAAVSSVRRDEAEGIHLGGRGSRGDEGGPHEGHGGALSPGDEGVRGLGVEAAQGGDGAAEVAVFLGPGREALQEPPPLRPRGHEVPGEGPVPLEVRGGDPGPRGALAPGGERPAAEEVVRGTRDGGDDDDERAFVGEHEAARPPDGGGVREGRASELPDLDRLHPAP
jgi:hypothetical protein